MLGRVVVEDLPLHDAPERCKVVLKTGRKLTHIKRKVLRGQSRIRQGSPHVGVTREKPSTQDKVPVKGGLRTKLVIQRIWVGDVLGLLQSEEDAFVQHVLIHVTEDSSRSTLRLSRA